MRVSSGLGELHTSPMLGTHFLSVNYQRRLCEGQNVSLCMEASDRSPVHLSTHCSGTFRKPCFLMLVK